MAYTTYECIWAPGISTSNNKTADGGGIMLLCISNNSVYNQSSW